MIIKYSKGLSLKQFAYRSELSPPSWFIKPTLTKVSEEVRAPNLHVLATAAYRLLKCGGVAKKTKPKIRVAYELYTPDDISDERWFCQFIKNIDDKTFLGRWYLANSASVLDKKYARPVVFEWNTVKRRV